MPNAAKVYQNVHIIFEFNKTSTNGHWPKGKVKLDAYTLNSKMKYYFENICSFDAVFKELTPMALGVDSYWLRS